ncbi:MAG: hypothetical protein H0X66_14970 [Verrucomicrobia bacterium]|nr:hypothetical protein [Verrucomicrobiota bacterium]
MLNEFSQFKTVLRDFISRSAASAHSSEQDFNSIALQLFAIQFEAVVPYKRLCEPRKVTPENVKHWTEIPSVPTRAFKELEITSLLPGERTNCFHSSGTTEQKPSRHFQNAESLAIYETSLLPWFHHHLLADWDDLTANDVVGPLDKPGFISLTPSAQQAPHSSLVHMFETACREFGSRDSFFAGRVDPAGAWTLDIEQVLFGIRKSMCANRPIIILGTAFSFVHLLDHFAANNMRYRLAAGSRVLETGGYKGRSRELPKNALHTLISKHLGIPASHIVCEYGMSELSSQAYDRAILFAEPDSAETTAQSPRVFQFPPWARGHVVSPETGREVADGKTGLIRVFDLANVHSVMAVQTEDLGIRHGGGFELIGRAQHSEPRGCSLMPAQ